MDYRQGCVQGRDSGEWIKGKIVNNVCMYVKNGVNGKVVMTNYTKCMSDLRWRKCCLRPWALNP